MNGTCFDIDQFKSTLHVKCMTGRQKYIAEFQASGSSLILNRFYTDLELPSTTWAKRVAQGTMVLIGDEEIRILNYGINRKILLEMDRRQPNVNIEFADGKEIKPLLGF